MSTIVLTGGGTAGHIMPNLALVPELKKHFKKIVYIGGDGMEATLVPEAKLDFYPTKTVKFSRTRPLRNLKIPLILRQGINEAERILSEVRPDIVFAKGGYASLPACFAARKLKIPVVIHESDMSLGIANRVVKKFAAAVLTSFPETQGGIFTGNPVREEIFSGNAERAKNAYGIETTKHVLLIVGGSSGSVAVNELTYKSAKSLSESFFIIHISGRNGDFTFNQEGYLQLQYAKDIPDLYALADIVVTRAGANALAEVTSLGKKVLAIPLPKGSSRGDQLENARSYENKGLLTVAEQHALTPASFVKNVTSIANQPKKQAIKTSKSNEKIVQEIIKVAKHSSA